MANTGTKKKRTKKPPQPSIWEKPDRYGTSKRRGSPENWRAAFQEAMTGKEADEILGKENPWTILGIRVGSKADTIKRAYRKLAKKYHPDMHVGVSAKEKLVAAKNFTKVTAAYVKLGGRG